MTQIEISPPADVFAVEFEVDGHLRFSVILTATSSLTAMLIAWGRFPEYKLSTTTTRVHNVAYVAIDAETGSTTVVKVHETEIIPPFLAEEPDRIFNNDWHIAEEKGK